MDNIFDWHKVFCQNSKQVRSEIPFVRGLYCFCSDTSVLYIGSSRCINSRIPNHPILHRLFYDKNLYQNIICFYKEFGDDFYEQEKEYIKHYSPVLNKMLKQ